VILTDTGPQVALIDINDTYYARTLEIVDNTSDDLLTTAHCWTEAMYLLHRAGGFRYQDALWDLRAAGVLSIHESSQAEYDLMKRLMMTYADVPMDLADAAVVATAQSLSTTMVFTFDKHFYAYRLSNGTAFDVLR
jgi:predicted nucleic acid-binding protein